MKNYFKKKEKTMLVKKSNPTRCFMHITFTFLQSKKGQGRQHKKKCLRDGEWKRQRKDTKRHRLRHVLLAVCACLYCGRLQWRWVCVDCSLVDFGSARLCQWSNVVISFFHCFLLDFSIRRPQAPHQLTWKEKKKRNTLLLLFTRSLYLGISNMPEFATLQQ